MPLDPRLTELIRRGRRGALWLLGPLPGQLRGFVLAGLIAAGTYGGAMLAYTSLPFVEAEDREQLLQRLGSDERQTLSIAESGETLVAGVSDTSMLSFDYCLNKSTDGALPRLLVYQRKSHFVSDALDFLFRLGKRENYDLAYEVTFRNPERNYPVFLVDTVRFFDSAPDTFFVALSSYNCGVHGFKYTGIFDAGVDSIQQVDPGPLNAYQARRGPDGRRTVLAPYNPLVTPIGEGVAFAAYSFEDAIFFADTDKDGDQELITAAMIWDDSECHWCEHRWLVSAWNFEANKRLYPATEFCRGESVVSPELYTPGEINGLAQGTVGAFGTVSPVNLQSGGRGQEAAEGFVRTALNQPGGCDILLEDIIPTIKIINYVEVTLEGFVPKEWTGPPPEPTPAPPAQ